MTIAAHDSNVPKRLKKQEVLNRLQHFEDLTAWLIDERDLDEAWKNCKRADLMMLLLEAIVLPQSSIDNVFKVHNTNISDTGRLLYRDLFRCVFTGTETFENWLESSAPDLFVNMYHRVLDGSSHHHLDLAWDVRYFFLQQVTNNYHAWELSILHAVCQRDNFEVLNYLAEAYTLKSMGLPYITMESVTYVNEKSIYETTMAEIHAIQADTIRRHVPHIRAWIV